MQQHDRDFFPLHDLTHYAVETSLRYRDGFWGLVMDGWGLADFGKPWPRGPLPVYANVAELVVGMFDLERGTGVPVEAEMLNEHVRGWYGAHHPDDAPPLAVSGSEIAVARATMHELHARWRSLEPGESIELVFDPSTARDEPGAPLEGDAA